MKRILAHKIIYLDQVYEMSVVTIDGNRVVDISPFKEESHSTVFISGTIKLIPRDSIVEIVRMPG